MDKKLLVLGLLIAPVASLLLGCGADEASNPPVSSPGSPPSPVSASTGEADIPSSTPNAPSVNAEELQSGLKAMETRVLRTVDAYSKVEPTPTFRYFMHPTMDKDASIEFDISGLASVTLSPRIGDLSPECLSDPNAGVVQLSYALDGGSPVKMTVDRNYNQLLPLELTKSRTLKVEVNQGNDAATCDWFGLGIVNVTSG